MSKALNLFLEKVNILQYRPRVGGVELATNRNGEKGT